MTTDKEWNILNLLRTKYYTFAQNIYSSFSNNSDLETFHLLQKFQSYSVIFVLVLARLIKNKCFLTLEAEEQMKGEGGQLSSSTDRNDSTLFIEPTMIEATTMWTESIIFILTYKLL